MTKPPQSPKGQKHPHWKATYPAGALPNKPITEEARKNKSNAAKAAHKRHKEKYGASMFQKPTKLPKPPDSPV